MPSNTIRFFICTRNRPEVLGKCISSVAQEFQRAFPSLSAHCYVFDDSTSHQLSAQVSSMCKSRRFPSLHLHRIGLKEQKEISQKLGKLEPRSLKLLNSSCKKLGTGSWDLAGVRNFAFLFANCISNDDDLLIFLDDDILFQSTTYHGHFISIDGAAVLRQFSDHTPQNGVAASGVGYLGRSDISIKEHVRLLLEDLHTLFNLESKVRQQKDTLKKLLREISLFPTTLPIRLNHSCTEQVEYGPGISGAALATTSASLKSHGLLRCYNEDWIWLSLLGESNDTVRRIEPKLIHAAPPQLPITIDFLIYQNIGEIIYYALEYVMKDIPSQQDRISWCKDKLSLEHFVAAKQDASSEICVILKNINNTKTLFQRLNWEIAGGSDAFRSAEQSLYKMKYYFDYVLNFIGTLDPAYLYKSFSLYLTRIPVWQNLLKCAKFKLGCFNHHPMEV